MTEYKSFYKTVSGNEGSKCYYPTRLDTYGCGCANNCSYCYAKSLLSFRGLWHPQEPSAADITKVRRRITKSLHGGDIVRLGGMTDCFQSCEAKNGVTYETIQELNRQNVEYLIVTKNELVASDKYVSVMSKDLAHIQVSITCTDDNFAKTYEHASLPSKRIEAVERLYKEGFDVSVRLSPFIPQFINTGRLNMGTINSIDCDKILIEFLRVNNWVKKWFDIDYNEYTITEGGYKHMPLELKKNYIQQITGFDYVSVCEDESEAYNYWKTFFNPNPNDCCNLKRR